MKTPAHLHHRELEKRRGHRLRDTTAWSLVGTPLLILLSVLPAFSEEPASNRQKAPLPATPAKATSKVVRHPALEYSGPRLTDADLEVFEREIGGKLPRDYRDFMLAHNGGITRPSLRLMWKGNEETILAFEELLPLEKGSIRSTIRHLRELNATTTDGFLPVAWTGGDLVCLDTKRKVGAVYHTVYKYKTVYERDLVPIDVTMEPLAGSFREFVNSLTEIPEMFCPIEDLGRWGTVEELERYLSEGNFINAVGKHKRTLVCEAVACDNLPILQACIQRKASLSGTIHTAVQLRRTHQIERLVQAGADINERDERSHTPLYWVIGTALPGEEGARNRELYDTLVKFGAKGGRQ